MAVIVTEDEYNKTIYSVLYNNGTILCIWTLQGFVIISTCLTNESCIKIPLENYLENVLFFFFFF